MVAKSIRPKPVAGELKYRNSIDATGVTALHARVDWYTRTLEVSCTSQPTGVFNNLPVGMPQTGNRDPALPKHCCYFCSLGVGVTVMPLAVPVLGSPAPGIALSALEVCNYLLYKSWFTCL